MAGEIGYIGILPYRQYSASMRPQHNGRGN